MKIACLNELIPGSWITEKSMDRRYTNLGTYDNHPEYTHVWATWVKTNGWMLLIAKEDGVDHCLSIILANMQRMADMQSHWVTVAQVNNEGDIDRVVNFMGEFARISNDVFARPVNPEDDESRTRKRIEESDRLYHEKAALPSDITPI